jgi:hypothetical protein
MDLARLAMCIDCEGSIAIKKQQTKTSSSYSISIQIGNTELKLIEWLCNTFNFSLGVNKIRGFESKIGLMYMCVLSASKASSVLKLVSPYLIIKRAQADLAISMQETMGSKGNRPSEEVYSLRESIYQESRKLINEKDYSLRQDLISTKSSKEEGELGIRGTQVSWDSLDLARLAMCIDCEGSIVVAKRVNRLTPKKTSTEIRESIYSIAVQVGTADVSLSKWLKATFGFPIKLNSYTKKGKAFYISALYGKGAYSILTNIKEFLIIKKRQAELAISMQRVVDSEVKDPFNKEGLKESIFKESRRSTKVLVTIREGEPLFDKFNGKVKELV